LSSETGMSVKYWHANTEEQVRAAFPDY
jgi:hypothetical protein